MLAIEFNKGKKDLVFCATNRIADPTTIREDMTKLLQLSFDYPVIIFNGRVTSGSSLVDTVADIFQIDRHKLGNELGAMQLAAYEADPSLLDELRVNHGIDKETAV